MEIIIDKARAGDAARIIEYLRAVGGESDNLLFGAEGLPITVEQEEGLIERLNSGKREVMFAARDGEEIVGICQFSAFSRERIAHRGEIAISVRRAYWGTGVGSRMMEAMLDFAKNTAKVSVVSLEVWSDNARAIALYKRFGFESFGTFKRFFCIDGKFCDAEYMNLYL